MKIELFYAPGCDKCDSARGDLKNTAERLAPGVEWLELNILENMDYAVELGVLTLPAMAVDGTLEFTRLPSASQLAEVIARKSAAIRNGS